MLIRKTKSRNVDWFVFFVASQGAKKVSSMTCHASKLLLVCNSSKNFWISSIVYSSSVIWISWKTSLAPRASLEQSSPARWQNPLAPGYRRRLSLHTQGFRSRPDVSSGCLPFYVHYFDANTWGFFNFFFFNIIIFFYLMSNSWTYLISQPCSFFSFSMGIMGLNESFVLLMVSSRKGNFSLHHQKKMHPVLSERCPLLYNTVETLHAASLLVHLHVLIFALIA